VSASSRSEAVGASASDSAEFANETARLIESLTAHGLLVTSWPGCEHSRCLALEAELRSPRAMT